MKKKSSYNYEDMITSSRGEMFGKGNAQLPSPPMLMVTAITDIHETDGLYGKGYIKAHYDIADNWFFDCHFIEDPVMPGCLGVDAWWQLLGFFLGWTGGKGRGRALGVGKVKFFGQVLPTAKKVEYFMDIKRLVKRGVCLGVADASLHVDGKKIYSASDLKVGLFTNMESFG